jgi:hypothetical protein
MEVGYCGICIFYTRIYKVFKEIWEFTNTYRASSRTFRITQHRRLRNAHLPFNLPAKQLKIPPSRPAVIPVHKMDNPVTVHPLLTHNLVNNVNPPTGHNRRARPERHPDPSREHPGRYDLQTFRETPIENQILIILLCSHRSTILRHQMACHQNPQIRPENGRVHKLPRNRTGRTVHFRAD